MTIRHLVFVTGFSGSGKSTALKYLEDLGFAWVDNLPIPLLGGFLDHLVQEGSAGPRVAVGLHVRHDDVSQETPWQTLAACRFQSVPGMTLDHAGMRQETLFLEASLPCLIRRYRETRRRHPFAIDRTVRESIELESKALEPVRAIADIIIDTSAMTVPQLKDRLDLLFQEGTTPDSPLDLVIFIRSFGFKYGTNTDADIVLDGRFLANPYYDPDLRSLSGLDAPVQLFLEKSQEVSEFLDRLQNLFDYLVPRYRREKKRYLTVDIGCTGGQHRSVYLVERLASRLRSSGFRVLSRHRDLMHVS